MKSFTTSPSVRGIWVLAGGAAAALLLAAGTASAATSEASPRPVEPAAKPVAKGHEYSVGHQHRHHAVRGKAGHLGRDSAHHIVHHHLTHHLGVIRLPFRPVHHHSRHLGHWGRLHHAHAAVMLPGQAHQR